MAGVNVTSVSFLLQILFLTNILLLVSSEECVKNGVCRCDFENGTYIDLTSGNDKFYVASTGAIVETDKSRRILMYYFNPCKEIAIDDNTILNECKQNTLCKRIIKMTPAPNVTGNLYTEEDSGYLQLGVLKDSQFLSTDGLTVVKYIKDSLVVTSIRLICSHMEPTLVLKNLDPSNAVLDFYSPQACLAGSAYNRHSFGTTLVIVFFVMALVYLILGCCVKYFLMGARGIEVFPNINFWKELPNLIKDGLIFVQNGFKPPPQSASPGAPVQNPNPNSYDSI